MSGSNRDDFTATTVKILGQRVGYICSNPDCRRHTIGPNEHPQKSTLVGIAAHITGASPKGPRFSPALSPDERVHIDNGIWLCGNCSILIDKDDARYSVELLREWKSNAEIEMYEKLSGSTPSGLSASMPFIEADLIWNNAFRMPDGYSYKNPIRMEDGKPVMIINIAERLPIIFWKISWNFTFTLHNNSRAPAYNLSIENIGTKRFRTLDELPRINNVPPYGSVKLKATYRHSIEGTYLEADAITSQKIPSPLEGLSLKINYRNDFKITNSTIVTILENDIINTMG